MIKFKNASVFRRAQVRSINEQTEDERSIRLLDRKFYKLSTRLRCYMSLYGLLEDATLLFQNENKIKYLTEKGDENFKFGDDLRRKKLARLNSIKKAILMLLAVCANVMAVYVMVAHIIWEFKTLERKNMLNTAAAVKGWSVLKEFLENLRRHLSRLFALALMITWHFSCKRIELLFSDCRKYYSIFYRSQLAIESQGSESFNLNNLELREKRRELLESTLGFYHLARSRINWSLWLPISQFLFNMTTFFLFPSSSKQRSTGGDSGAFPSGDTGQQNLTIWQQAMQNFDSFHLAIHTAFHSFDHRIVKRNRSSLIMPNNNNNSSGATILASASAINGTITDYQINTTTSAIYCVAELIFYSMYVHGPRIISATCLSLVLNIHYLCIKSFNLTLMTFIKRGKQKPLIDSDLRLLIKQNDLISAMHERIETTFKWSIIQWYGLMFISCLMHIFSFTESTSAYVLNSNSNFASKLIQLQKQKQQQNSTQLNSTLTGSRQAPAAGQLSTNDLVNLTQTIQQVASQTVAKLQQTETQTPASSSSSSMAMFVRLASVFFVCYSPYLIYVEASKIEAVSNLAEQLIMKLSRRQDDLIAQSIEPSLFEPICLDVGGYFKLSKKSMSSFMGAIVTFSVMFIGKPCLPVADLRPEQKKRTNLNLSPLLFFPWHLARPVQSCARNPL